MYIQKWANNKLYLRTNPNETLSIKLTAGEEMGCQHAYLGIQIILLEHTLIQICDIWPKESKCNLVKEFVDTA